MFSNYIKITLRNLWRNKFYSLINIIGLSIGIICSILIVLYVQHELSYDKHHENYKRIYRLDSDFSISGKQDQFAVTAIPLGPTLKMEYPEIEEFVRFFGIGEQQIKYGDKEFFDDRIFLADSTVFKIFTHKFLLGEPEKALTRPSTIVLTKAVSDKLFGPENPIGKTITTAENENWEVTGVIEDLPENSHLKFSALLSVTTITEQFGVERFNDNSAPRFWNIQCYTYVLIKENADINNILINFPQFYEKYMASLGNQINASFNLMISPLTSIHYTSKLQNDQPTGNMVYIYTFMAVAIFLLSIACINYMNMATARSTSRAKEVGIRKTMGADRPALIRQFLSESLIISFIALLISLLIAKLIMPVFNEFAGTALHFRVFADPLILLIAVLITIFVGVAAGSYPAFYLASFQASRILKGELTKGRKSGLMRKFLVVIQFIISVIMIFGTLTVRSQLGYMRDKNLGFEKEDVLVTIVRDTSFTKVIPAFIEELKQEPAILAAATSTGVPGRVGSKIVFRIENDGQMEEQAINLFFMDYDYLDLLGVQMAAGRNYQRDMGTDLKEAFVINQAAAEQFNWGTEAVGKRMQFGFNLETGEIARDGKVIGVTEDFNYRSLHNRVEPLAMMLSENPNFYLSIRIDGSREAEAIESIQQKWTKFGCMTPYKYDWQAELVNESYSAEEKLGKVFSYFSLLCIFIACLGLLGLSSFVAEQRTKEIGTRKVLGATVANIVYLLSRDFVLLVIIANVFAQPLAHYALSKWLQNFAYRSSIGATTFVLSAVIALIIAMMTVSYQAIKAAVANPVESLRYE